MRTQKRFTPAVLDRYTREGRGTGTLKNYLPWHRVSRADPSSLGRSHLIIWRQRQRELLSDGEWTALNFATMLPNVVDLAEQFPLAQEDSKFELSRWDIRVGERLYPGTVSLARALGIKHPQVMEREEKRLWTATTDLLLVLRTSNGRLELLAISCKPGSIKDLSPRALQLQNLERSYWSARNVPWLLITSEEFEQSVGLTLRRIAPWGLDSPANHLDVAVAVKMARAMYLYSVTDVLHQLARTLVGSDTDLSAAQSALWQAVWNGHLPIDLRRGWRPHVPLSLISPQAFYALNPIAMRRSAWK